MSRFSSPQVILFSSDVERSVQFYSRFGFEETFRVPHEGSPIHADMRLDGYTIGFASVESSRNNHGLDPAQLGQRATITLWCDDVRSEYAALVDAGVTGLAAPAPWLGRLLIAWLADPDGHPVQLAQNLSSGDQAE